MILRFSIENWMSFRHPTEFSMIATRERQHVDRVPRVAKYQTSILPVAAIYGGNASGKTNFSQALNFVRKLVTSAAQPESLIAVEPFRLGAQEGQQPSRFAIELLMDETIYAFSFAATRTAIVEEKLIQIARASEKVLYDRRAGEINFDVSLKKDSQEAQFLEFAFRGTRDNQLFLTNSVSQKVKTFQPVYDWFKNSLELIAPDSRFALFERFLDKEHPLFATMSERLPQLDTGICRLGSKEIPFDSVSLEEPLRTKLQESVKEGMTLRVFSNDPRQDRWLITRRNGELTAKKLVAFHAKEDGSEEPFEIQQESDGTQRIIDLLPAFAELATTGTKKVYVIDELDRSLHTLATRQLIESYLAKCSPESRMQLLFTTHDVLLMDQSLLRRDEMWVAERDTSGSSTLTAFSEYHDVRYDKDIRKSYLQGRLGGIPHLAPWHDCDDRHHNCKTGSDT